jgi:SynChlorMet cassette radical SAM/SPASM protein ScmE
MTFQISQINRKLMKSPRSVDIDITTRCNLRCSYCYHFGSAGEVKKDLPTTEWIAFFEELGELAVMDITLAGGEPFIRKDITQILQGITDNQMRFTILSNGTLISEEVAEEIAATRRCNTVQISIDGANAETHDSCRGSGSFHSAIDGIRNLQQYRVPVGIRLTIHHKNVYDLRNTIKFVLDDLGVASLSTNSAGYFGMCQSNSAKVQLTIEERCLAMRTLIQLSNEYPGRITANAGPFFEAIRFQEIEQAFLNEQNKIPGMGYLTGCGCCWSKIAVRADGIIVPCALLPSAELGLINHDSILYIWHHHQKLQEMRKWHQTSLSLFPFCKGCPYIPYCSGLCPAIADVTFGNDRRPGLEGCYRQFLDEGGILPNG